MKNQQGMTLVELVVAIVIISLALVTMMSMFDLGIGTTGKAEWETKALALAQLKMEEAKNNPVGQDRSNFSEPDDAFEYKVIVEEGDLMTIKVWVFYQDKEIMLITKLGVR